MIDRNQFMETLLSLSDYAQENGGVLEKAEIEGMGRKKEEQQLYLCCIMYAIPKYNISTTTITLAITDAHSNH